MEKSFFIFLSSAAAVFTLAFPVCGLLRRLGVIDRPTDRSSHNQPTVRGGGTAILAVILMGATYLGTSPIHATLIGLVVCAAFLAAISFVDDIKSVNPLVRFGCHALAAAGAMWLLQPASLRVEIAPDLNWNFGAMGSGVAGFLLLVGYTNSFNFMDGINGLAAGQAALTAAGAGLIAGFSTGAWDQPSILFCFLVAGAAAGFLPHNFPVAKVFMGDVGSAPLGFLLASLTLWLARDYGWWLLIPLALLHANFVLDTGITLMRRARRREAFFQPHREHFYQRLVRADRGHVFATGWEMGLQLLVLALMLAYLRADRSVRLGLIAATLAIWGAFFCFCENQFQRRRRVPPPQSALPHGQSPSKVA